MTKLSTPECAICELCDKAFPNRVQKSNHKLLVHTVREEDLNCDYCDEIHNGLKELCKHISSKHGHLFSKRIDQGNQCYICKMKLSNKEDLSKHMDDSHSPDSFYEKLVEKMSSTKENDGEVEPEVVILEEEAVNYQSSSWGGEEKEGYTFKGKKRQFGQASLEIQRLFFTNKEYNLEGVKFSLEKKTKEEKGSGLSYLIDIEKNGSKGSAVLKTWNKNSKNEYKIVVTKSKKSDLVFVKILSEVVNVLLEKNISGEGWSKMTTRNIIECKTCGKFYSSDRYLKAHPTKVHGIVKEGAHAPKPCTICNKTFKTEMILKGHAVLCNRQNDIKRKRKSPGTPSKLIIEQNTDQIITCHKCNLKFKTELEISKHLESEHSSQTRVCSIWDLKFTKMSALEWIKVKHDHEHTDCDKMKISAELKQYVCELCDFKSSIEAHVKNHMSDKHATGAKYVTPPPKKRKKEKETDDEDNDQMALMKKRICFQN